MRLVADVITIRDGKTHELKDKKAILAGKLPLMTGDKVFLGVTAYDDEDQPIPGEPFEVDFQMYYGALLDIAFKGNETKEQGGLHWLLGGQGLRKLVNANGFWAVVRLLNGTPGTSNARFVGKFRGMAAEIFFPYVD